jgi:hypothetical protein
VTIINEKEFDLLSEQKVVFLFSESVMNYLTAKEQRKKWRISQLDLVETIHPNLSTYSIINSNVFAPFSCF